MNSYSCESSSASGRAGVSAENEARQAGSQRDMNVNSSACVCVRVMYEMSNAVRSFRFCAYNVTVNLNFAPKTVAHKLSFARLLSHPSGGLILCDHTSQINNSFAAAASPAVNKISTQAVTPSVHAVILIQHTGHR
jgi:hypothetical protein